MTTTNTYKTILALYAVAVAYAGNITLKDFIAALNLATGIHVYKWGRVIGGVADFNEIISQNLAHDFGALSDSEIAAFKEALALLKERKENETKTSERH